MSVDIFPKGISPKLNAIARLEFELAYDIDVVQTIATTFPITEQISQCI